MKKLFILCICLFILTGCGQQKEQPTEQSKDGKELNISSLFEKTWVSYGSQTVIIISIDKNGNFIATYKQLNTDITQTLKGFIDDIYFILTECNSIPTIDNCKIEFIGQKSFCLVWSKEDTKVCRQAMSLAGTYIELDKNIDIKDININQEGINAVISTVPDSLK